MILPLGFAKVNETTFRSGYPAKKTWDFVSTLKLKTMISLIDPSDVRQDLRDFCTANGITFIEADVGVNKEPFLSMDVDAVNRVMACLSSQQYPTDASQQPVLIFCSNGKLRTSCVVGCFRRQLCRWSLSAAQEEFDTYADGEGDFSDALFIENYTYQRDAAVPQQPAEDGAPGGEARSATLEEPVR